MLVDVAFRLKVGLRRDPPSQSVIAYCPALELFSAGESEGEAQVAITGAIKLYLETCWERGQFEQAMRRSRFQPVAANKVAAARDAEFVTIRESAFDTILDVDVPLHLVGQQTEGTSSCLH